MTSIVICPRVGEEAVRLPGEVRHCELCGHAVLVTPASLALARSLICTPCAQEADVVPRNGLTEVQRDELRALGYSEEQIDAAVSAGLRAYHEGRRS